MTLTTLYNPSYRNGTPEPEEKDRKHSVTHCREVIVTRPESLKK